MKKIFTLAMGVLMTTLLFAADRRPSVILNSSRNFEVVIDGRSFMTNGRTIALDRLHGGKHQIKVYELRRGFRGGLQKRLVSQSSFRLRGKDLMIRISYDGQIMFKEARNRFQNDRDRDRNYNDEHGWDYRQNDRDERDDRDVRYDRNERNDRNDRNDRDF